MYLDLENARRAVARGADALDRSAARAGRNWRSEIDLDRLDMWSHQDCILGQLFADLDDDPCEGGLDLLGLENEDPADYGFTHFDVAYSDGGFGMRALEVAWKEEVTGERPVVRVRCNVDVEVEFDPSTGVVEPTIFLPEISEYRQVEGPELTKADRLRVLDWSWRTLNFESRLRKDVEFTVIGYWSKSGRAVAIPVTTDTPEHASALAPVANRLPGQKLIPICALSDGELVWSAVDGGKRAEVVD